MSLVKFAILKKIVTVHPYVIKILRSPRLVNYYGLFNIFWEHEARPPRLSSRPACHARHERAGGGRADIKHKV